VAQQYKLVIRAEGEVRDKDGNLISTEPLEGQTVITEEQAAKLLEALAKRQGAAS
jgi:hypothetical protein